MDYYNEIDPYCAEWLQNLMDADVIGKGVIDTRSIEDVTINDVRGYTQVHFFAGIGVWSYALRQAGFPPDRPVWTGSCPCQPFSAAGKGGGFADERHLWPAWLWLIRGSRPDIVFGEQVASKDGLAWLDTVSDDMAGEGYAFGPMDICSAGFGSPNIRQRQYFVGMANNNNKGLERGYKGTMGDERSTVERSVGVSGVADAEHDGSTTATKRRSVIACEGDRGLFESEGRSAVGGLGDAIDQSRQRNTGEFHSTKEGEHGAGVTVDGSVSVGLEHASAGLASGSNPTNGFWRGADWLGCRDGKWRPVEPSTFPLASGASSRVGRLRAYGNAINAEVAIGWIEAFLAVEADGFVEVD